MSLEREGSGFAPSESPASPLIEEENPSRQREEWLALEEQRKLEEWRRTRSTDFPEIPAGRPPDIDTLVRLHSYNTRQACPFERLNRQEEGWLVLTYREEMPVEEARELLSGQPEGRGLIWREYLEGNRLSPAVAQEMITTSLFPFVVMVAQCYDRGGVVDCMDLIQEGHLALLEALKKFDLNRGYRFITYASQRIRRAMSRVLFEQGGIIYLPAYLAQRMKRLAEARHRLTRELGRPPSLDELIEDSEVREALKLPDDPPEAKAKTLALLDRQRLSVISLSRPLYRDQEIELEEVLALPGDSLEGEATERIFADQIETQLEEILDERELRIVYGHYVEERTFEELGRELGITRQAVQQIEVKALGKVREHLGVKETAVDFSQEMFLQEAHQALGDREQVGVPFFEQLWGYQSDGPVRKHLLDICTSLEIEIPLDVRGRRSFRFNRRLTEAIIGVSSTYPPIADQYIRARGLQLRVSW